MSEVTDDPFIPQMVYWGGVNFILLWCFVLWLISQISGWSDLAAKYPLSKPPSVDARPPVDSASHSTTSAPVPSSALPVNVEAISWKPWQHGRFRGWVGYNGCLWIGVSEQGLALKTGPDILFRFCHPPIFIPWTAVHIVGRRKALWRRMIDLKFQDVSVTLSLPESTLESSRQWIPSSL